MFQGSQSELSSFYTLANRRSPLTQTPNKFEKKLLKQVSPKKWAKSVVELKVMDRWQRKRRKGDGLKRIIKQVIENGLKGSK